jgi:hypothetical protein
MYIFPFLLESENEDEKNLKKNPQITCDLGCHDKNMRMRKTCMNISLLFHDTIPIFPTSN